MEEATRFVTAHSDFHDETWPGCVAQPAQMMLDPAFRQAAKRLRPDSGGDPSQFRRLQIARAVLNAHAGQEVST